MTSSWDSYYIVFLSAVLSLGIPAVLAGVSFAFFRRKGKKRWDNGKIGGPRDFQSASNRTILGQRINVRFFLAANAALVLITLILALIPCVTTLQSENHEGLLTGLVSIVTIVGFAVLALLYAVRKGDMGWLSTYNVENKTSVSPGKEK